MPNSRSTTPTSRIRPAFPLPVNALADAIRAADGVIFCTPEYNFTIPGGLKNAIDWVSRVPNQPFAGKPVALQSASPGPVGGARVQYDMRKAMAFLDAFVINKPEIFVGNCASKIDEKTGEIKDEATRGFIKQQLAAFVPFIARVDGKGLNRPWSEVGPSGSLAPDERSGINTAPAPVGAAPIWG